MAVLQQGANDETADEIATVMQLQLPDKDIEAIFKAYEPSSRNSRQFHMNIINRICIQNSYTIRKEFQKLAKQIYKTEVDNLDFIDSQKTLAIINEWVKRQTESKIQNFIELGELTSDSKMILISTLFFRGQWKQLFQRPITIKTRFYKSAKEVIEVDTMQKLDFYNYCENKELKSKFLEIPFEGDDISMIIVLPNDKNGLAFLEENLDKALTTPDFIHERVKIALPKFHFLYKVGMKQILLKMGITKAFSDAADFTKMAGEKGSIFVDELIQKVCIHVNEEGVEAGVASEIMFLATSTRFRPKSKSFIVDHPFMFFIREKDIILFGGRVTDPT